MHGIKPTWTQQCPTVALQQCDFVSRTRTRMSQTVLGCSFHPAQQRWPRTLRQTSNWLPSTYQTLMRILQGQRSTVLNLSPLVSLNVSARYLRQFLQGCGVQLCPTPLCASNPNFPFKDANEIASKARETASNGPGELCPRLETRPASGGQQREIVAGN